MSKHVGRFDQQPSDASDTGFEALQSTEEFRGPVEPLDGHENNDHFALIYEDRAEQFATVVPFVRQGLERGERCMYMVDDNSRDELIAGLRDGGVDVDAAFDAGQLSIHSIQETYLKGGEFDVDEARDLLRSAMEEALDEYEGFRVTAEETWLVNDESAQREFMTCEAHMNNLLEGEAGMALCQYNRAELPPEVIEDVINTHPYLIYDDTACPNEYYVPPKEYFGPDHPARENDRKLETLVDRTDARAALQTRERYERGMYEITSDPERSFGEKLDALFDLGCEWFGLDLGGLAKVDPETNYFEVEVVSDDHEHLVPGAQADLSETYCRVTTDHGSGDAVGDPVSVTDPVGDGFEDELCYEEFGVRAYLGSYLEFDEVDDRTFWFVSNTPRDEEFSESERTFHHLMGQWVRYELERRERERKLRERTEHLRALVETTPECIKTVADDGTLLQMNPAGLDMVEADSESSVVGECVYDLIVPEHRERFREFNERICRGERGTLEFDIVGLDGTRRHMETHAAPLHRPDGTTVQVALTRDITEQKEHERELERVERQFEATFNNPSSFMGLLDTDGTVQRINETALEFADVDEAEVRGEKFWETPWFAHSEDLQADLRAKIARAADGEYVRGEIPHQSSDGEIVIIDAMLEPVRDEDGEVVAIVPSGNDITERKEHAERLEQKTDRLESFASMLAHELRNPVTIGQIYSQKLPAETDAEAVEYVAEAFDRIENMIDVMLVLTRGRDVVDEETPVDLASAACEAWDDVDAPDATLDVDIDRTIHADETYVRHLFQNLLDNAVEHGGDDVTVTVGDLPTGFYVADDGVGISPEERDAIFDEGYTTASNNGGTGLGLAFVQKLAEVYEWDYTVTESDSGGARFEFRNIT